MEEEGLAVAEKKGSKPEAVPPAPEDGGLTSSVIIFRTLKTTPDQTEVTIDEVVHVLSRLLKGIMDPAGVENMVTSFAEAKGITSELAYFNEHEFRELINRLLDDWIESIDKDGDGNVSKKEFYQNVVQVYGWQAWLVKRNINRTFDNIIGAVDIDHSQTLSKEELKIFLRKFATGELDLMHILDMPKVVPKSFFLP